MTPFTDNLGDTYRILDAVSMTCYSKGSKRIKCHFLKKIAKDDYVCTLDEEKTGIRTNKCLPNSARGNIIFVKVKENNLLKS